LSGATIESRDPATFEPLGSVAVTSPELAQSIVGEVAAVTPLWAQLRVGDRARYLERAAQAVIDDFDSLCELVSAESGRPPTEIAAHELLSAVDTLSWLASNARALLSARPVSLPRSLHPLGRASAGHAPLGVVAAIGCGSAPFAGLLAQTAAALIAGNGVVLKPAPRASQAGERIATVFARAGLPEGLVRVVHGRAELGRALAGSDGVRHVFFSGRVDAGAEVAAACARRGASVSLDLAASEAMIVLADANVARAASGAIWAACAGAGQLHGKPARIYVEESIHEPLRDALLEAAAAVTVGDPRAPGIQVGPLARRSRAARLHEVVAQASARGARVLCGGPLTLEGLAGAFHSPVVLEGSVEELDGLRRFAPGPLLGLCSVASAVEAVAIEGHLAPVGMRGASVWSADRRHAARIARELAPRSVWCNDHIVGPILPRDAADAVAACCSPKLITWDPPVAPPAWRFPYSTAGADAVRALAALHGTRPGERERALRDGAPALARVAARALRDARR